MPLIDPTVKSILNRSGMGKPSQTSTPKENRSISDLLDDAGLSLEETLVNLANTRDTADSEITRTRINETVLKMHGVLKEQPSVAPAVTIIIRDSEETANGFSPKVNPIMLPRESVQ